MQSHIATTLARVSTHYHLVHEIQDAEAALRLDGSEQLLRGHGDRYKTAVWFSTRLSDASCQVLITERGRLLSDSKRE
jgi:hypothetical protein